MSVPVTDNQKVTEVQERNRGLYDGPEIDSKLEEVIRNSAQSGLSAWDLHRILRTSQSVYFDTHVEVVSGHHTGTYLRFDSIAQMPQLLTLIARDMADWIQHRFISKPITGILTTASDALLLAMTVADLLREQMPLRVVVTPFDRETGRIGTTVNSDDIQTGDRFVVLNDVTTRGNCVSKLGTVVTEHGGVMAGMMVFARRDSGQFPLMDELTEKWPFYYTVDLNMPQWAPQSCPLCTKRDPLLSWKDLPKL